MKTLSLSLAVALAAGIAAVSAVPAAATGKISCKAGPQSGWKSMDALTAALVKDGWVVRKAKVDGGCYEVYATLPTGERVEAYFHPVTFEKLYVEQRGKVLFRKEGY